MKNKNVKYIGIGITVLVLVCVGTFFISNVFPTVNTTLEITKALQPFLDAENKAMHLAIDAEIEEKDLQLETDVYAVKDGTMNYLVMEMENTSFYVVDDLLLFENGKAFLLTEEKQDEQVKNMNYMDVIPLLAVAFDEFEIHRIKENEKITYQINVTGEQMKHILDATLPLQAEIRDVVEGLQIQLTTKDGELNKIQMKGTGVSEDSQVLLSVTISNFKMLEDGEYKIPQLIRDSAQNVDKDKLFCLTEDLYRLIKAMQPLSDMSKLQGTMNWQVSCGLIEINNSVDMEKLHSLKKEESGETEIATKLIELVGAIIMEGEISCRELDGIYVYELVLEETAMKELVQTMAPEIISYAVDFGKGSMKIEVEDEKISEITIGIEGSLKVLFTKVPLSVSVAFNFE